MQNHAAILATAGIKALLIGPFDLSVSLGHGGDVANAEVTTAIETLIDAACKANVPLLMPVFSRDLEAMSDQISRWSKRAVRCFVVGADKIMMAQTLSKYVATTRSVM